MKIAFDFFGVICQVEWPYSFEIEMAHSYEHHEDLIETMKAGELRDGAYSFVQYLISLGHTVAIVCNQPQFDNFARTWLDARLFPYHELITLGDKIDACIETKVDVLIDDNFAIYCHAARNDLDCILFGNPLVEGKLAASNWQEVAQALLYLNLRQTSQILR